MIEAIQDKYLLNLTQFTEQLKKVDHTIKVISYSRLFIALASIVIFYFALTSDTHYFYLLFFLLLGFTILAWVHSKHFSRKEWTENAIRINKEELQYLNQNYTAFDPGNEFVNFSHAFSFDLDIFGRGSLYQSLNRSVTLQGKTMLAEALSNPLLSKEKILSRQESVKELKEKLAFRQNFQATGMLMKESVSDREKLKQWLSEPYYFIQQKFFPILLTLLPVYIFTALIYSIYLGEVHPLLTIGILGNWLIFGWYSKKINRLHSLVSKKKMLLGNYSLLFRIVRENNFQAKELQAISASTQDASGKFKKLADYVGWFDQRLNILISPILNSLILFDLQCCYRIEKWRTANDRKVLPWLDALGSTDMLCSLGNFSYNNPDFIYPALNTESLTIQATDVAHPLIKRDKRVANSFDLGKDKHIAIITGANMAGKSTFLRTIGINLVLAHSGAPVCAAHFSTSLLSLISSMRISDSLKDDVSYFYAELQRLRSIKETLEKGNPTLILLDEMLRGTNSKDKQQGSKAFVENLLQYNCLALVATHDLLLGQLEEEHPQQVRNFCFESFLQDNNLMFDYRIRPGAAKNTNASFLMKNLGII